MASDPLDRISRIVDDGEDLPLTRIAAVLGLDKEIDRLSEENAKLRNENADLKNRFQQLAGGFELQGDHKSAKRVRSAL
jgi:regulator of replication initiation timing